MPIMCIICGAKKNSYQPDLTLHRLPKDERRRQKWLEAIGITNFNPDNEEVICSLHFKESSFTRTLHHTRLHCDAVPMSTNLTTLPDYQIFEEDPTDGPRTKLDLLPPIQEPEDPQKIVDNAVIIEEQRAAREVKELRKLCARQRKQIKKLQMQVVTRNKKIEDLVTVIKLLKHKKINIFQLQQK